jgi:hypothetical protein
MYYERDNKQCGVLRRFQSKEAVNGFSFGSHKKNHSRRMQSGVIAKGICGEAVAG